MIESGTKLTTKTFDIITGSALVTLGGNLGYGGVFNYDGAINLGSSSPGSATTAPMCGPDHL